MSAGLSVAEVEELQRAAEAQYGHTCTIVRTTDADDWDGSGSDTTVVSNQPCHFTEARSTEIIRPDGTRVLRPALLLLPRDVSVTEGDHITVVTDVLGNTMISNARGITSVQRLTSHTECLLTGAGGS